VEILDEKGNPVPAGDPGLLTITSLCNTAMPLIRYQNGDVVVGQPNASCECGRHPGSLVLTRIVGRSSDVLLRTDGEPAHWTVLYYAIKDAFKPGMMAEHQARQKALDCIELKVVKGPTYVDSAMDQFLASIKRSLGTGLRVDVVFVDTIEREESGKLRYFISDIPEARQRD
jgi:phenylacetate-CoA ligase